MNYEAKYYSIIISKSDIPCRQAGRYSVELRSQFYYTSNFFTIVDMVFPSALPPISADASPITLPIEAIPDAPVWAMILAIIASTSASESCAGKNFSITAI